MSLALEKAVSLYRDLVSICAKGGFQLTKWISNRHAVLAALSESHRAKDMKRYATCGESTCCGMVHPVLYF